MKPSQKIEIALLLLSLGLGAAVLNDQSDARIVMAAVMWIVTWCTSIILREMGR